jgi:hypothetical protein
VEAQRLKKEMKAGGQLSVDNSCGSDDLLDRGNGTEGGLVVDLRAAK